MSVLNFQLFAGRKLLASNSTHSPMGNEHSGRSRAYVVEDFLNSGVAVILAAMLCALICAVALGSLFRWARRRIRQVGAGSSDEVIVRLADTGLRSAAMETLPIVVYTSPSKLPTVSATDCPICLSEFVEGEKLRVLPNCNHSFHMECIDEWLASQSSCPICRHSLNLPSRNEKSGGAAIGRGTESNNAIHVVIETMDSTPIPPRTESLENSS